MGKAGKARKKQKLLVQAVAAAEEGLDQSDSDEEGGERDPDLDCAVLLLNTLSTRLQLYDGKGMKPLRISLFPLIQKQLDSFFEDPPPPRPLSEEEVQSILSSSNISATLRISQSLAHQPERFASLEFKEFRRALHPFVLHQKELRKVAEQGVKNTASVKVVPAGWDTSSSSRIVSTPQSVLPSVEKKQSLSNRVAYFYRVGDWLGALRALHDLRVSSDMPKLGMI